ncbi:tRNA 5-methoxyuridine(34)/uridine 5-oxyacetic acid(34) synthase CmoB [bacterium]|nr:tRNA 5-methoxyuridine(34)/uridine 5-oxyacetic acid(34) synthase CmoB [bacterium]
MHRKSIEPYINELFQASHIERLNKNCEDILNNKRTKKLESDLQRFSCINSINKEYNENAISVSAEFEQKTEYTNVLKSLMPWRKGPFQINDVFIDSEWQSHQKWNRMAHLGDYKDKVVLDIGSGNGYYLYKLLGEGTKKAIGLDPHLVYNHQFIAINHIIQEANAMLLPLGWQSCEHMKPVADYVLCMGVLYHQKKPQELLKALKVPLKHKGKLILETLIIDSNETTQLEPKGRYAAMKNIYYIPSVKKLTQWLQEAGYKQITCCDITATTSEEQRVTTWSSGESLVDFLNPTNPKKTIEGHPAPLRVIMTAINE